jgi:hypothetical protein
MRRHEEEAEAAAFEKAIAAFWPPSGNQMGAPLWALYRQAAADVEQAAQLYPHNATIQLRVLALKQEALDAAERERRQ